MTGTDAREAATDAVPLSGQPAVDGLVDLLDLERLEVELFRGITAAVSMQRVFGGQVAGQALVAAGRTVEPDRPVHSLHAYFLRPGDPTIPIVYQVDRIRDGRSFTTRRVVAIQHGKPIFNLSASFQVVEEPFIEHAEPMPDVPGPDDLPTFDEMVAPVRDRIGPWAWLPRPIDRRYVGESPWDRSGTPDGQAHSTLWMRADGRLPDDQLLHVCALTYASDMTLLDAAVVRHGMSFGRDRIQAASLDHAMWFHRPFRADEWFLYDCESPSASNARGFCLGRIWSRDGQHIATVAQEGLLRRARD